MNPATAALTTPLSLEALTFVPRFVLALCSGNLPVGVEVGQHLRVELDKRGVQMEESEPSTYRLIHGELPIGRACLLSPAQARERFERAPFLEWTSPCPFIGDVVAYLVWEHFIVRDPPGQHGAFTDLMKSFIAIGLSFIADLETGHLVELAIEKRLPLADLADRWGFDDGELLLTRADSPYVRAACRSAEDALTLLGFTSEIEWVPTSHNPLRFSWHELPSQWRTRFGFEPRRTHALQSKDGKSIPPSALGSNTFTFWALNLDVLNDDALWNLPGKNFRSEIASAS